MNVRIWLTPREATERIKAAKQLGITLVERKREGDVVMVCFSVPSSVNFVGAKENNDG